MTDRHNRVGPPSWERFVEMWRLLVAGTNKPWVVFEHGTCVLIGEPGQDLRKAAIDLLAQWGPVVVGTPAGDFSVFPLKDGTGWAVTSHHPCIATCVDSSEVSAEETDAMTVGISGRAKRDRDASELTIVHVTPGRAVAPDRER
jgi:hypothetical protein